MSYIIQQYPITVKRQCMIAEFFRLTDRTRAIVLYVQSLLVGKYNRIPVWTEFYRTQDQQNELHAKDIAAGYFVERDGVKQYSENKRTLSVDAHQLYRAADLSRRNLSDAIIEQIIVNVNKVFPYESADMHAANYRTQGTAHIHFQSGS